jgi:hypothetical protein
MRCVLLNVVLFYPFSHLPECIACQANLSSHLCTDRCVGCLSDPVDFRMDYTVSKPGCKVGEMSSFTVCFRACRGYGVIEQKHAALPVINGMTTLVVLCCAVLL